MDDLLSEVCI